MSSIRISEAKLAANRANALKSTGPRTPEGKAVARMNRLRHGIYAEDVFVPQLGETKEAYEEFRQVLLDELNPQSAIQYILAEQYIYDEWRLFRYRRLETGTTSQAWARNNSYLRDNRKLPIRDSNDYKHYDDESRLGKSRTCSDGLGAITHEHDHFTLVQQAEQRLRKASIQTLNQFYALAPAPGEPDPEPDPKPAFVPAPVVLRYGPKSLFELAKKLGKTLPPDLVPDPNEPPDGYAPSGKSSAEGVKR